MSEKKNNPKMITIRQNYFEWLISVSLAAKSVVNSANDAVVGAKKVNVDAKKLHRLKQSLQFLKGS